MRMPKSQITELEREDEKPFFKKEIFSFTKDILYFIDNEMVAVLQAIVIKELGGFLGLFSARAINKADLGL